MSRSRDDFITYRKACADITKVLNKTKKASWKKLCSNLDPTTHLSEFWAIAKKFKHCIYSPSMASNEDWFENFCNKISPLYVSSEAEISPILYSTKISYPTMFCLVFPPLLIAKNCYSSYTHANHLQGG